MATRINRVSNPSSEDWNAYSERFEQYVIANEIKDEKKIVATFLTTMGSKTYNVLRDLLAPEKPSAVKLEDLVKTLRGTETNRDRRTISLSQT